MTNDMFLNNLDEAKETIASLEDNASFGWFVLVMQYSNLKKHISMNAANERT